MTTSIDTLIVGAGQAGLALSHHLVRAGHEHVLLERGRLGQSWHDRWDSLTLLTPNWLNGLPGGEAHQDAHGFLDRGGFIDYLQDYARSSRAPVIEGVEVTRVERGVRGFRIETDRGGWIARTVVVATGECAVPHVPFPAPPGVPSLHAAAYRRPELLPDGRVLVVGGGTTGQQLAAELRHAGRDVVLAVGRHSRAPRSYRGRDIFDWLRVLGDLDRSVDEMPDVEAAKRVPSFPLSGAKGGAELGLDVMDSLGVVVAGRLVRFQGTRAIFADDLEANIATASGRLRKLLLRIDDHPLAKDAIADRPLEVVLPAGQRSVDVGDFGAIVWATGYRREYSWLRIPGALDGSGDLPQRQGATRVPGLYVLGLAFQHRRSSHFIGGVGQDAETLAREIVRRGSSRRGRRLPAAAHAA
jgi:putative flavoprotein involved in K+ transport